MTLQELSESYAYSAELLSRRLAQLRQEEREARDESAFPCTAGYWIWSRCCGNAASSTA